MLTLRAMGKAKINKVNQKSISFDESARKDFLTGFRKRKNERRQFARNKIAQEVRQEKLKDRQDKREADRSARGIRDDDVIAEEADGEYSDVADDDEAGMALVSGFNRWIEVVGETQATHHLAFMPLFGGTLVAWLPV